MILLSVDIETTGLQIVPPKSQVLSAAFVLHETNGNHTLGKYEFFIDPNEGRITFDNLYVLNMHRNLIETISKLKDGEIDQKPYQYLIRDTVEIYSFVAEMLRKHKVGHGTPTLIGKNLSLFDIPMLETVILRLVQDKLLTHRVIDIGNLYMTSEDQELPSLDMCMLRAGIKKEVPHTAMGDAELVLELFMEWRKNGKRGEFVSRAA